MKYKLKKRKDNGLCRVVALKSFSNITKGDIGGYVSSDVNLAQEGNCWVYGNAWVYGDARVSGDAQVSGNAQVSGDARVSGNAQVSGDARVYGDAWVYGNVWVYGDAWVSGNARVSGDAQVSGDARVSICLCIQQFRYNITATNTHVFIGCKGHTWEHWETNIETIGSCNGYSVLEINQTRQLLQILREQINAKDQ